MLYAWPTTLTHRAFGRDVRKAITKQTASILVLRVKEVWSWITGFTIHGTGVYHLTSQYLKDQLYPQLYESFHYAIRVGSCFTLGQPP